MNFYKERYLTISILVSMAPLTKLGDLNAYQQSDDYLDMIFTFRSYSFEVVL